jgi:hypothetical protein
MGDVQVFYIDTSYKLQTYVYETCTLYTYIIWDAAKRRMGYVCSHDLEI